MSNNVLLSLIRINRKRINRLKSAIAPYGYAGTMHLIVLYIRRHPDASQDDIVAYFALDKSSVARDARKLEELKHITRTINPDNRRSYQLNLTPEGEKFLEFLDQLHQEYADYLAENFSSEEWDTLGRLLQRMEEK